MITYLPVHLTRPVSDIVYTSVYTLLYTLTFIICIVLRDRVNLSYCVI